MSATRQSRSRSARVLQQAWDRTLRRRGSERALVEASSGRAWTFAELETLAADWRARHGDGASTLAGQAVVFAVPNGAEWLGIFLALLRAGAVAVPLDAAEPPVAQRRMAERLRAGFWWDGTKLVALDRPRRFRAPDVRLIKLTSGSTGEPRALPFTEAQLLADARQVTRSMGITAADLNYALSPFGHSYGLGNLSIPLLGLGVPVVCATAPLPQAIADDFGRWQPTIMPGVPAIFRALAASGIEPAALGSLRLAITAGAPLAPGAAAEFHTRFGRALHGFYGSSETGGIAYDRTGAATLAGSVGTAMPGVDLSLAPGGRLHVRSAAVFTTGNRRSERGVGCWVPPDRVERDARGRITLLGRRGVTVKIAGRRVSLTEVAARLRQVPGVSDVWVGVGGGVEPALGAAVATTRPVAELRAELQWDTPAWKIPKRWELAATLPLTPRGKVDARGLQKKLFG